MEPEEGLEEALALASKPEEDAVFCCGGALTLPRPLKIFFEAQGSAEDTARNLALPCAIPEQESRLAALLDICKAATFGKGKDEVLDEDYRKTLQCDASRFATTFELSDSSILEDVKRIMMPNARSVRAEPYKLHVYRPGDFFKPHVDTPRGAGQFGSLVVSLPCEHEGGDLVIRFLGREVALALQGTGPSAPTSVPAAAQVHWAAFYSDCEHEVKEVKSGHRMTLTYNLYAEHSPETASEVLSSAVDVTSLPLYSRLKAALASKSFLSGGGCLAIPCAHAYPHTNPVFAENPLPALKGADAARFAAAHALGCDVSVQSVWDYDRQNDVPPMDPKTYKELPLEDKGWDEGLVAQKGLSTVTSGYQWDEDQDTYEYLSGLAPAFYERSDGPIIWLGKKDDFQFQLAHVTGVYGNEPSTTELYCGAAIIIRVPAWPRM